MNKSIFEMIIEGEIPSHKIYEDEKYIAILDIDPKQNGHTLIIPKIKKENIFEEDELILSEILNISKKVSKILKEKLNFDSIKLQSNIGAEAGQIIFHTHIHLIPYYKENQEKLPVKDVYKKIIN